jgi:hypothetical protein
MWTLATAAADRPDFYIMMGDDFGVDTLDPETFNERLTSIPEVYPFKNATIMIIIAIA